MNLSHDTAVVAAGKKPWLTNSRFVAAAVTKLDTFYVPCLAAEENKTFFLVKKITPL